MSSIEERLVRDIAAVTGGVVVTESDLQEARDVLERNMDGPRWSRRRTAAVLVAAAVVLPIVGVAVSRSLESDGSAPPLARLTPSAPVASIANDPELWLTGRAPTTELMWGVWREDNGGVQLRFGPDGTFSSDHLGQPFTHPGLVGTWVLAGDRITVDVNGGSYGCAGETIVLRASQAGRGLLHVVPTQPAPTRCPFLTYTWEALEQVVPTPPAIARFPTSATDRWKPWSRRSQLHGLWLVEGGGYAMELGADGAYVVAGRTGEPVDRGRWSYRGTELSLTSSSQSVACAGGDRLVWSGVEQLNPGTFAALRATVQDNTCDAPWAARHWIRIPDSRTR